jgi:hypothetical protein
MTREDVRKQLAKNPLNWDCTKPFVTGGVRTVEHYAEIAEISYDASVFFTIREKFEDSGSRTRAVLCLSTIDVTKNPYDPYEVELSAHIEMGLDDIKRIAEVQRLDLACRMLGVME